ncbi:hypothetical protein CEXT_162811 [Caerostris extrusa]|uniref:Secreted protein n=1 Tax=Caerostris extrusa TaxID=172846 RepID=A0AAV4U7Z3_CAEEX|nr:hypothetical protein CEXT_162811 [Caerostris extrusa]
MPGNATRALFLRRSSLISCCTTFFVFFCLAVAMETDARWLERISMVFIGLWVTDLKSLGLVWFVALRIFASGKGAGSSQRYLLSRLPLNIRRLLCRNSERVVVTQSCHLATCPPHYAPNLWPLFAFILSPRTEPQDKLAGKA